MGGRSPVAPSPRHPAPAAWGECPKGPRLLAEERSKMLVNYRLHSHRTVATADLHLPYLILPKNIPLGDAVEQRVGNLTSSAGHQNTDWFSLEEKHRNYKIQRFLHICDLRLNEKGENRKSSSVIRLIKM